MSQKEKTNDKSSFLSEAFVNACWQPYEAFQSQLVSQIHKQDEQLSQAWKNTSQQVNEQRDKAQQFIQEAIDSNPFFAKSEAMKNVALQAQAILRTPLDFTLDLLEKTDAQRGERLQSFTNVHDQFVSGTKQNQRALFRLVETNVQKLWGV